MDWGPGLTCLPPARSSLSWSPCHPYCPSSHGLHSSRPVLTGGPLCQVCRRQGPQVLQPGLGGGPVRRGIHLRKEAGKVSWGVSLSPEGRRGWPGGPVPQPDARPGKARGGQETPP